MTDEYKNNVVQFLTGYLPEQEGQVEPQFDDIQHYPNNLQTQIEQYFSSVIAYTDFVPSKNNRNQNLEYSVLACRGTLVGSSDVSGAFIILDKNYNIVEVITNYSDGSLIGGVYCLNVDDQGNYYAIELNGSTYRIVLLNNLVLKPVNSNTYQAIKIETYNIPNQYSWGAFLKIFKNEGGNKYFAVGNRTSSNGIVGCELTIGNTQTWKYYLSSYTKQNSYAIFDNGYNVYWDSNSELHFQIAVSDYGLVMLTNGSGTTVNQTRYTSTDDLNQFGNFIFYSNKLGYYAYATDDDPNSKFYIYKVDLETKQSQLIYSSNGLWSSYNAIWFFKNSNSIYYFKIEVIDVANKIYELSFALVYGDTAFETSLGTFTATNFIEAFCYPNVINDFNLNYIYIQNQDELFYLKFLWNDNNYNGQPYTSSYSLIPNSLAIYEAFDPNQCFNKNIFNLSTYANQYTASVQIPRYSLNNEDIYLSKLYSINNNPISENYPSTTKNIYEELIINTTNKFVIKNEGKENIPLSGQFTNAMMNRQTSIKLSKCKINYADDTSTTQAVDVHKLVYTGTNLFFYIISMIIYTDKQINSIDLLSEDETITYKTIDCSSLELNKYYKIEQELRYS
jgi:hypothetical protein